MTTESYKNVKIKKKYMTTLLIIDDLISWNIKLQLKML